jgi:hypothetical protein
VRPAAAGALSGEQHEEVERDLWMALARLGMAGGGPLVQLAGAKMLYRVAVGLKRAAEAVGGGRERD